jgi:NAD(P)-dependent dehydrogenase (short-subunit alcohol dehydrogenase family)
MTADDFKAALKDTDEIELTTTGRITGKREASMTATTGKTALIIGASRGLGYALAAEYLARGWQVTATERGATRTGLDDLAKSSDSRLVVESVDITVPEEVAALHDRLARSTFDLLFVNARVTNDPKRPSPMCPQTPSSG